jgi:RNA polymerase sigma-B factor
MSGRDEHSDVADMFRLLTTVEQGSAAFRRQREAIIQRCLPLADHIAQKYCGRGEPRDDLTQVARVGLVNAVNRFDLSTGRDFVAFAVPTILGEIRRHFRDCGWALKVPRRVKDIRGQLNKARDELSQQFGRAPNATELAEHLNIDRQWVIEAIIAGANYTAMSTDAHPRLDEDDISITDTLGGADAALEKVLDIETARPLIAALPEQLRTVLVLRFFEGMTQSQIAARLGYSQMQISRLLAKALATLRGQVRESGLAVSA